MHITCDGFIEIDITTAMLERADAKAKEMGRLRNSIRKGTGNLAGFLGEEVVLSAWPKAVSSNTYQHDVVFEEVSFEVKTKDRTRAPELEYEASVANYNTRQRADFYVFTSLLRVGTTYRTGYLMGIIDKPSYFNRATHLHVGDVDPSNGWVVRAECYNLPYRLLHNFSEWNHE